MRAFAEEEIVIPDGPFAGRRFRCSRQPYTASWFAEVDSGNWSRYVATGPTQSGKTLACFVIPLLYHLFELQETVICGLPEGIVKSGVLGLPVERQSCLMLFQGNVGALNTGY
jgi:hypothetical protein